MFLWYTVSGGIYLINCVESILFKNNRLISIWGSREETGSFDKSKPVTYLNERELR